MRSVLKSSSPPKREWMKELHVKHISDLIVSAEGKSVSLLIF